LVNETSPIRILSDFVLALDNFEGLPPFKNKKNFKRKKKGFLVHLTSKSKVVIDRKIIGVAVRWQMEGLKSMELDVHKLNWGW